MKALRLLKDAQARFWNLLAHSKLTSALFIATTVGLVYVGWWMFAPTALVIALAEIDRHWRIS